MKRPKTTPEMARRALELRTCGRGYSIPQVRQMIEREYGIRFSETTIHNMIARAAKTMEAIG